MTELHEAILLWVQARDALTAAVRVAVPFVDPSSEPFYPLA